ncbi:MAG: C25 family cysteine peptidase [Thermoplasmata archaeon]
MKKAIISFFAVCILLSANVMGIFLFSPQEEIKGSFDEMVHDREDSNIGAEQNQMHDSNLGSENNMAKEEIDWHSLPQDRNPKARLFLEKQIIAIEFRLPKMTLERTEEGEIVYLDDSDVLLEPGRPMVPEVRFFVAVPPGSKVTNVEVVEQKTHTLEGNHVLAPYIPRTLDGKKEPVEPDTEVYSSHDVFPSSIYEILGLDKLRHLDAIEVVLYPVRVRPALGIVEVFDLLRLRVELEAEKGKELTPPSVPADDRLDGTILDSIVNPEDVGFYTTSSRPFSGGPRTRAPSTISHTLGFQGSASEIHTTEDTTVGNVGGVALLKKDDDSYYVAEAQKTMYVDGFDIATANPLATLEYAMLHVQYKGPNGYDGDSKVRFSLEGGTLQNTTIQPTDLNNKESSDESFDLLGHAGSPNTVSDLADMDIEFTENGVGGGSKDIPFDYIRIEFAYREEFTGDSDYLIITNLQMADELTPLAEWKTDRLNIDTQLFDIDWIDANWNGTDLKERIHDFIRSMYENYSIEWVLLCGDDVVVPTDSSSYDNYYANVVGFIYPDVIIGRLPSSNDYEMEGMVEDILANQRDMRSWKKNIYLVGTNVFSTGDGKNLMTQTKDASLKGNGHVFYEDYEVDGNNSNKRTIDTYNIGMGASAYYGHGSSAVWTMSNGSKTLITRNDVRDDFTNSEKRGFVWTLSCSTAKYLGSSTSLGERWVIVRNGGGIGYIGGAELVYVSPGMGLYRAFWREYEKMLDNKEMPTQGEVHFRAMNTNYYRVYVLYGDPQVGLSLVDPNIEVLTGRFDAGTFIVQKGFDQEEKMTFETTIKFPPYVLPKGVHLNFTVQNEGGNTYYPDETFIGDPGSVEEKIFLNWTVPLGAAFGIYNVTIRLYNESQGWEFVYENQTYFFVDYNAFVFWVEQVNSEVIEGDTVIYRVHIDNFIEPIPAGKVWVNLEGRDYAPYMTPFNYYGSSATAIPAGLDFVVEVEVKVLEPGTYNITAGLHIDWALMDSAQGNETEVRGIRILDVSFNHPLYFREDPVNISYRYFAFSDFIGNASLFVKDQTDQLYEPHNFFNGTNWLNFTWTVPKFLPNGTHDIDLEIYGFSRSLETGVEEMRVVIVREILDKGENWLIPKQQPDGGWEESNWGWPPGSNYNETARAMQALLWSGVDPSDPVIQDAADYVESSLNLSLPGRVDDFAETVWALSDAGRGSSKKVQDSAEIFRQMQNWIYEPENWTLNFQGSLNDTWLVNVSGYDGDSGLLYWHEYNGTINSNWTEVWVNFSVLPGTVKLNVTVKTSAFWLQGFLFPPFYKVESWAWDSIRVDDYQGPGDGITYNWTISEKIEFDRGWGRKKAMPSLAGFTAWAAIGLLQSGALGPLEIEALETGVQWLLDNQSADGSWAPYVIDGMGWGGFAYPDLIVGGWAADPVQNTALPVIALIMHGTLGKAVDDAVEFLKLQQAEDGSYPYSPSPWDYRVNLVSTSHALRALRRAGYVFEIGNAYVREAVRWLCIAQDKDTGNWDEQANFTRVTAEAMLALASLRYLDTMELEEGWNLISISLIQSDTSLSSVLESIDGEYDAVQWYDPTDTIDPWKHHQIIKPSHLNDLDEINHDMGFWIHITKSGGSTFRYIGSEPQGNQQITLHKGWNLVGYPSLTSYNRTQALNNLTFGTDIDAIWAYNAVMQRWEQVGPSSYFEVGRGYWVHAITDRVWEVPI